LAGLPGDNDPIKGKAHTHSLCIHTFVSTSNVTNRHQGPKCKCTFVYWYVGPPGECYYNTLLCWVAMIICYRQVWYRTFSLHYVCIQSLGIILIL